MTDSAYDAYVKAVRKLFQPLIASERSTLIAQGSPHSSAVERDAAYTRVRAAIDKKTLPPPKDWVSVAEAAVYIGEGGSPRTLANLRRQREAALRSVTITKKRDANLPGLAGMGSGKQTRYLLSDIKEWVRVRDQPTPAAVAASSSGASTRDRLDEGISITSVAQLLNELPWLVLDGKLRSNLLITRLTEKRISAFFAQGAEVAWFPLHEAITEWVWDSPAERLPWSEGYLSILEVAQKASKDMDALTKEAQAREQAAGEFGLPPAPPGKRVRPRI